jgi:hypothetical protein
MGLSAGTRLGPYEIVSAIGAGGMSACGRRAERVGEPRRGSRRGGGRLRAFGATASLAEALAEAGAPRHFLKQTHFAHSGGRQWR